MAEYVCPDGRMSVNGVCPIIDPFASSNDNIVTPTKTFDQKYQEIEDIPKPGYRIRDQLKRDFLEGGILKDAKQSLGETFKPITNKAKDFSKNIKSTFEWDFDKAGNDIKNFNTTIKGNIATYDEYIENNLGIPVNVSHGLRAASVGMGVVKYGALGAVAPFLLPFLIGGNQKRKEQYRIDQNQMRDEVATIQSRVDNQYQNQMTTDNKDFSVSGPDTSANPTGKSNQASSERGYQLHG